MTLIGSLASYSYQLINGKKFSLAILCAQVFISIFAGSIVYWIASYFSWDFELAGGLAGLAGWSGASMIKVIEKRVLLKINGEHDEH